MALLGQGDGLGLCNKKWFSPPEVLFISSLYRAFHGRFPQCMRSGISKEWRWRLGSTGQGDRGGCLGETEPTAILCGLCKIVCFAVALFSVAPIS